MTEKGRNLGDMNAFPDGERRGMRLRHWLAGQALAGLLAQGGDYSPGQCALDAVRHADALLDVLAGEEVAND